MALTPVWTKTPSSPESRFESIVNRGVIGENGTVFITGSTRDGKDQDFDDAFISKYNSDGTLAWTNNLGIGTFGGGRSIAAGANGSAYVTAYCVPNGIGSRGSNYLFKYNSDGTLAWTRLVGDTITASNVQPLGASLTSNGDDSIFLTSADTDEVPFISKYNGDGTLAWKKSLGTAGIEPIAIAKSKNDSVYVAGNTITDLDGKINHGYRDIFVSKLTGAGNKEWTTLIGGDSYENINAITIGKDDSIYIAGYTAGVIDGLGQVGGVGSGFVAKFKNNGAREWIKAIQSPDYWTYPTSITTDELGFIYVAGVTDGNLNGEKSNGLRDSFIVQFATDGRTVSTGMYGTPGYDYGSDVFAGRDGFVYLAGRNRNVGGFVTKLSVASDPTVQNLLKLSSVSASKNQLILAFSEGVQIAGNGSINPEYLTITVNGQTRKISTSKITGSLLTLTLAGTSLDIASSITFSYNPPTTGNNKGFITDLTGNKLGRFGTDGIDTYTTTTSVAANMLGSAYRNLILSGIAAINGIGNNRNNTIIGNDANNILDGGTEGEDTLIGGKGNDTYIINEDDGDDIVEKLNEGIDTVQSSVDWTLGVNLENLTLVGSKNLSGTGNELNNVITGNNGNNVLDGGAGNDTLIGGKGDDTYFVNSTGDIVTEKANEGNKDTVISSISWSLGLNLENLSLTGTDALTGIGNSNQNRIIGNDGNNILNGGIGADTLIGGKGDDNYIVDNVGDTIVENDNEGTDTVQSSAVKWTLSSNLENLTLTGTANLSGTGNELNNVITGNSGNNVLDGGEGDDTMIGGKGDDTYFVNSTGDIVTEKANEGADTIVLLGNRLGSYTYTLAQNVENLIVSKDSFRAKAIGNNSSNVIESSGVADILTGMGGADVFRIASRPRYVDYAAMDDPWCHITDFSSAQGDKIQISKRAFGITASAATLSVVSGSSQVTTALSGSSLFVYDNSSGELYWNQNGNKSGFGSGGIFAMLDNKSALSVSNISLF